MAQSQVQTTDELLADDPVADSEPLPDFEDYMSGDAEDPFESLGFRDQHSLERTLTRCIKRNAEVIQRRRELGMDTTDGVVAMDNRQACKKVLRLRRVMD